jgi:hypothetical protein
MLVGQEPRKCSIAPWRHPGHGWACTVRLICDGQRNLSPAGRVMLPRVAAVPYGAFPSSPFMSQLVTIFVLSRPEHRLVVDCSHLHGQIT